MIFHSIKNIRITFSFTTIINILLDARTLCKFYLYIFKISIPQIRNINETSAVIYFICFLLLNSGSSENKKYAVMLPISYPHINNKNGDLKKHRKEVYYIDFTNVNESLKSFLKLYILDSWQNKMSRFLIKVLKANILIFIHSQILYKVSAYFVFNVLFLNLNLNVLLPYF